MTFIAITADYAKLRKVRRALRRKGVEAYLPAIVHKRPVLKSAKVKYRRRVTPLMSYILAKAPDHHAALDLWLYDVLQTKDVRGHMRIGESLALIPDNDVFGIWCQVSDILREIALAKRKNKRRFRAGEKARMQNGTLAGRVGTIQWIKGKRAGLEAKIFGAMRVVEVQVKSLEHAA